MPSIKRVHETFSFSQINNYYLLALEIGNPQLIERVRTVPVAAKLWVHDIFSHKKIALAQFI
jgi:hypothetical protein